MSVQRIASRYAKSLLDLAKDQNQLDDVHGDITGFLKAAENRDLELLIKSPIIHASKKIDIFDKLFGSGITKLTKSFFDTIIKKGREYYLVDIAHEFLNQYRASQEITLVKVTTAQKIGDEGLDAIKKKLKKSGVATDNIKLETVVDEDIIGGFVLEIGDKMLDNSVAYKLKEMSKVLVD